MTEEQQIAWKPLPPQELALTCPAREVAYAGEKGAGKTEWLAMCWTPLLKLAHDKWVATGQKQHRCRIAIFRKNLNHLEDFINKTKLLYPLLDPAMGIEGWNINRGRWTFSSGATIEVHHLDGPNDHLAFQGQEFAGLGYDQIEQLEEHVVRFINANLRSGDPDYHQARIMRCTANPGGFDWIIPYFHIQECPQGGRIFSQFVENADGSKHEHTRCFIRARLRDNPHLPPDYEAQLRATMNEDEIAMYLEGDFFRVAGSYFSKFLRAGIHFQKSRPVPSSWTWRHATDWGSTNPACTLVGAVDEDNVLHVVDELYKPGVTGRKYGESLDEKWRNQAWSSDRKFGVDEFWGVIDKQAMDKYGGDSTAAAGICDWGFRLFEAKKDRLAGCNQLKERFLMDRFGKPRIIIFEDRCPNLVRALSAIPSNAPKDPEDYNESSPHAHAVDALRFLAMEFPIGRDTKIETPEQKNMREWESYLQRAREKQNPDILDQAGWT